MRPIPGDLMHHLEWFSANVMMQGLNKGQAVCSNFHAAKSYLAVRMAGFVATGRGRA